MKNTCHLVSFADGAFVERGQGFIDEATNLGLFDTIRVYDFDSLETEWKNQHRDFVYKNKRGFGYWIWKPQCVLQRLEEIEENELLVYMDVGFEINAQAAYRFKEYFQLTLEHENKMLSFSNTHTEYRWTKADLFECLGLSTCSKHALTTQLAAGFFVLQNTLENRLLIQKWRDVAILSNYHYSNDELSHAVNHKQFVEHRHDASIFSLLRKLRGTEVCHYEVQSYNHFETIKSNLPAWASRKGRVRF